jgi:hypothetical protein
MSAVVLTDRLEPAQHTAAKVAAPCTLASKTSYVSCAGLKNASNLQYLSRPFVYS